MKITVSHIITAVTLLGGVVTIFQVMSKPQAVSAPQSVEAARANAQSFDQKIAQLESSSTSGDDPEEVHFTSEEVSAELAQSMGAVPAQPVPKINNPPTSTDTIMGQGQVEVKGYQVQ